MEKCRLNFTSPSQLETSTLRFDFSIRFVHMANSRLVRTRGSDDIRASFSDVFSWATSASSERLIRNSFPNTAPREPETPPASPTSARPDVTGCTSLRCNEARKARDEVIESLLRDRVLNPFPFASSPPIAGAPPEADENAKDRLILALLTQLEESSRLVETTRAEVASARSETENVKNRLHRETNTLARQVAMWHAESSATRAEVAELKAENSRLKDENHLLLSAVKKSQTEVEKLRSKIERSNAKITEAREKLEKLRTEDELRRSVLDRIHAATEKITSGTGPLGGSSVKVELEP